MGDMTCRDTIAEAVLASRTLLARYLSGFDDGNHTKQAPGMPNHVAWSLGHCALTMYRASEKIDGRPPPETEFVLPVPALPGRAVPLMRAGATVVGAVPSRFIADSVAFRSTPLDNPSLYPSFARSLEIFDSSCESFARMMRSLPSERVGDMIQWGQIQIPIWAAGLRMTFHNGTHCGQITDLRRALGMKSIFE